MLYRTCTCRSEGNGVRGASCKFHRIAHERFKSRESVHHSFLYTTLAAPFQILAVADAVALPHSCGRVDLKITPPAASNPPPIRNPRALANVLVFADAWGGTRPAPPQACARRPRLCWNRSAFLTASVCTHAFISCVSVLAARLYATLTSGSDCHTLLVGPHVRMCGNVNSLTVRF